MPDPISLLTALTTKPAATRTEYLPMRTLLPDVAEPAPLAQLEAALAALKAKLTPDEEGSIRVHGLQNVTWSYVNQLTEEEAVVVRLRAMEATLERLAKLLPADGSGVTLTSDDVQALVQALREGTRVST